jgi:hypothetical protein
LRIPRDGAGEASLPLLVPPPPHPPPGGRGDPRRERTHPKRSMRRGSEWPDAAQRAHTPLHSPSLDARPQVSGGREADAFRALTPHAGCATGRRRAHTWDRTAAQRAHQLPHCRALRLSSCSSAGPASESTAQASPPLPLHAPAPRPLVSPLAAPPSHSPSRSRPETCTPRGAASPSCGSWDASRGRTTPRATTRTTRPSSQRPRESHVSHDPARSSGREAGSLTVCSWCGARIPPLRPARHPQ